MQEGVTSEQSHRMNSFLGVGLKLDPDMRWLSGDLDFSYKRFDTKGGVDLEASKELRKVFFFFKFKRVELIYIQGNKQERQKE